MPHRDPLSSLFRAFVLSCFRDSLAVKPGSGQGPFSRDNSGKNLKNQERAVSRLPASCSTSAGLPGE
jgi:hypothetical protein